MRDEWEKLLTDPLYFCAEHFVERESCVHCMFGDEADMWFFCDKCSPDGDKDKGPWGWGWRGQCLRCMPLVMPITKTTS